MYLKSIFLLLFYSYVGKAHGYVELRSSGPTVLGANVTLTAEVVDGYPGIEKKFLFRSIRTRKTVEVVSSENIVNYSWKLSPDKYKVGFYTFEVKVYGRDLYHPEKFSRLGTVRVNVPVTETLNGELKVIQNGVDKTVSKRVNQNEPVTHVVELSKEENHFLTDGNTYIVYWFINCSLVSSTGLSLDYTYTDNNPAQWDVLVEVDNQGGSSMPPFPSSVNEKIPDFHCSDTYKTGYTYGHYRTTVEPTASGSSSPRPSQDSSDAVSTPRSDDRPWRSSRRPDSRDSGYETTLASKYYDTTPRNSGENWGDAGQGHVELKYSGPTVVGADLTLSAVIDNEYVGIDKKFNFRNAETREVVEINSSEAVVNHTIKLSEDKFIPGIYIFDVQVFSRDQYDPQKFKKFGTNYVGVRVTDKLNGKLKIIQNGLDKSYGLVYPNEPVTHVIELSKEEERFLTADGHTYIVYWYINCTQIAYTGLELNYTYEDSYTHNLEVLVEVQHDSEAPFELTSTMQNRKLPGFVCSPTYETRHTYGYYKATVSATATDSSPPPPSAGNNNSHDDSYAQPSRPPPPANLGSPAPLSPNKDSSDSAANSESKQISINNGHLKIEMDVTFDGTFNITPLGIGGL